MEQNLKDSHISLRLPTEKDLPFIRWLWSDPETMRPVGGPIHLTDAQAQDWFAQMIKPGRPTDCYRLILNENHEPVGEISFHRLDPASMIAEFNVKVASRYRGQGYARKAMLVFLDFFFNEFGGQVMVDNIAPDNYKGQQVLLQFGFDHDASINNVFRVQMTRERFNGLYISQGLYPNTGI